MSESLLGIPAAPAETVVTYGGFAEIARRLNALHPERTIPFSRQLVERWYKCRGTNDFPERHPVNVGGHVRPLFHLATVELWHAEWTRKRRVNPPIETIPLFSVDQRGHPVDAEQTSYRGHPADQGHSEVRGGYRDSILDL